MIVRISAHLQSMRWEDNIKIDVSETGLKGVNCIQRPWIMSIGADLVSVLLNLRVHHTTKELCDSVAE